MMVGRTLQNQRWHSKKGEHGPVGRATQPPGVRVRASEKQSPKLYLQKWWEMSA